MRVFEAIARRLAPTLKSDDEVRTIVAEEVARAKMNLPITASYDPKGEGYRRLSGAGDQRRDLVQVSQERMFEIAYYMWDASAMTKRLATMDKTFLFGEPVTVSSDDDEVQVVLDRFWKRNKMALEFPDLAMWLGYLGEQCWPATVNPHNGEVALGYVDPVNIADVITNPMNVREIMRVDLAGSGGRPGRRMPVIREDRNALSQSYGRRVGECFFFSINHPPNSPRGRSDFLTLFDWIDALERFGFNFLERAEFLLNFIWDVTLKGMDEEQIRKWMQDNGPPEPGSQRAHNEQVEWKAVSPQLNAGDQSAGFNMAKSFIMGAAGRPDAWFGGGGKAYQTEADQFGQVPIKDLDQRQLYLCDGVLTDVVQFVIDQAVIAGRLSEAQAEAGFKVTTPEISKKDFSKLINGVPQLTTALTVAEDNRWISHETAAEMFALVAGQFGMTIDAAAEMEKAGEPPEPGEEDYEGFEPTGGAD